MSDHEAIWVELDKDPTPPGAGALVRRLPVEHYDVFLTQSRPHRRPGFRVETSEAPGARWKELRSSHGLEIQVDARPGKPASLQLTELDARFHDILEALVRNLVRGLEDIASRPPSDRPLVMEFLAGRIASWQACLKQNNDGLSGERRAGLFGELHVLSQLIAEGVDPALVLSKWTGPASAVQDFQFADLALEIKASRQTQPTNVRISSERQLDTTTLLRLLLVHVSLDERSDGIGTSLPEMVATVRSLLAQHAHASLLLEDSLIEAGYLDLHEERYVDRSYGIRSMDCFDVVEPMPRIVEADLPIGVGRVSYDLSLAACEPFRVASDDVRTLFAAISA